MADKNNSARPSRRAIRLKEYDYSQAGMYFVTVVTQARRCWFGEIVDGEIVLGGAGNIVTETLQSLSTRFGNVASDLFVVMPNHLHAILTAGAQFIAPADGLGDSEGAMNRAPTLGEIVRAFKAISTRKVRSTIDPTFRWQRNYYEHVIRNEESLDRIRQYISDNPLKWELDPENPQARSPEPADAWRIPVAAPVRAR